MLKARLHISNKVKTIRNFLAVKVNKHEKNELICRS